MKRTSLNMNTYDEFSRQKLWYAGLLAFRDHPLLGIGPDNFRRAYGHYLGREQTDDRLHANNFYIEVLATLGIAGLAAFVWLIVALGAHGAARGHPPRQSRAGLRCRRGARGLPGARHARLLPRVHADLRAALAAGGRAGRARTRGGRAQPRGRQRARSRGSELGLGLGFDFKVRGGAIRGSRRDPRSLDRASHPDRGRAADDRRAAAGAPGPRAPGRRGAEPEAAGRHARVRVSAAAVPADVGLRGRAPRDSPALDAHRPAHAGGAAGAAHADVGRRRDRRDPGRGADAAQSIADRHLRGAVDRDVARSPRRCSGGG